MLLLSQYLNNNFLNNNTKPVDTIEESREIARTYIVDLKNKIPSLERTYLRLLSIYYREQDALDLNILKIVQQVLMKIQMCILNST